MSDDTDTSQTVMLAFSAACPRPTAADVQRWSTLHPKFAREIAEEAELLQRSEAMLTDADVPLSKEDEEAVDRLTEQIAKANRRRRATLVEKARSRAAAARNRPPPEFSR